MLTDFQKKIQGKSVAIVGNLTPTSDLSKEIDAHDIVIRLNHFYNYDSGLVGKKVDMLFVTPTMNWKKMSPKERHQDVIQRLKPEIFAVKHYQRIDDTVRDNHFKGCKIYKFQQNLLKNSQIYTTGTAALQILSNCANFTCDYYCFSFDDAWKHYIETEARHYSHQMKSEDELRKEYVEILSKKTLLDDTIHPVICVRKGSSLKDKNIRKYKNNKSLLQICIEKALKVFGQVTVLADDEKYCELATKYGATVPYLDQKVDDLEDVTVRLRRWRDKCNIKGRIILIQCTSPDVTVESIERVKEMSKSVTYREVIVSTVRYNDVKYSALLFFDDDNKYVKQILPNCHQISKPRQVLRPLYHYNGAFVSFSSSQLDKDSLFDDAHLVPCMLDESEGLDIDTAKQFNK